MRRNNKALYGINNILNEALNDDEQFNLMIEVENQWEDLMRDIQNTYKHYDRPLDYELKLIYIKQWKLLIKHAMLIGYDNIDMIKADLETFMDENDYKKTWCVILLGNRRKVEYNAKLLFRKNTYDGWPKDFDKPCQIISEYLTEGEATVQADKLNSSLSKSDKLINRMKYVAIKMHLVKK